MMASTSFPVLVTSPIEELLNQTEEYECSSNEDPGFHANLSQYEYPYRINTWVPITGRELLKIAAYLIVFLVSLVGNLLVILVVCYNRHMRTSTNQYLVNLAAADLLVTLVCMWVHIVRHLSYPHYVLSAEVCKLDGFVQDTYIATPSPTVAKHLCSATVLSSATPYNTTNTRGANTAPTVQATVYYDLHTFSTQPTAPPRHTHLCNGL
ncbi:Neuropeptide FF receptor 1 [Chionoecetes opilio]|uniref:Neuropeptide FF receptor 1 n=1 Tax=Chionoecetes opilio TaxID=41210 RepID=A0A8J4XV93_CHIOP|nr:Neuropeptide FF receptor 1 [Chionoecetes opilio]